MPVDPRDLQFRIRTRIMRLEADALKLVADIMTERRHTAERKLARDRVIWDMQDKAHRAEPPPSISPPKPKY